MNIVTVSDLSAIELTALVKKECRFTHFDPNYEKWDYYLSIDGSMLSGRGKRFEYRIWQPKFEHDQSISYMAICRYFSKINFYGHTGAFTEMCRIGKVAGYCTTIPELKNCWRGSDGDIRVPAFYSDDVDRELYLDLLSATRLWYDHWSFVGFCELK